MNIEIFLFFMLMFRNLAQLQINVNAQFQFVQNFDAFSQYLAISAKLTIFAAVRQVYNLFKPKTIFYRKVDYN